MSSSVPMDFKELVTNLANIDDIKQNIDKQYQNMDFYFNDIEDLLSENQLTVSYKKDKITQYFRSAPRRNENDPRNYQDL